MSRQHNLYLGIDEDKLRYFTLDGELVPLPAEAATAAQQQTQQAQQAVQQAQQRAQQAQQKAEEAQQKAARLADNFDKWALIRRLFRWRKLGWKQRCQSLSSIV